MHVCIWTPTAELFRKAQFNLFRFSALSLEHYELEIVPWHETIKLISETILTVCTVINDFQRLLSRILRVGHMYILSSCWSGSSINSHGYSIGTNIYIAFSWRLSIAQKLHLLLLKRPYLADPITSSFSSYGEMWLFQRTCLHLFATFIKSYTNALYADRIFLHISGLWYTIGLSIVRSPGHQRVKSRLYSQLKLQTISVTLLRHGYTERFLCRRIAFYWLPLAKCFNHRSSSEHFNGTVVFVLR